MLRSDNLIPLTSGAYQARSTIADAQVCENLFPELNPEDTDPATSVTHYPREGLRPISTPPAAGAGRGVFTLSNGNLFAIVGTAVFYVSPRNWTWVQVGRLNANISTPVSMSDNGVNGVLVDGTADGFTIGLATNAFAPIDDPTGTFVGSRRVDFADTFLAFAAPGTNQWYTSLSDQVAFNALAQAAKDSAPDPIQTLVFNLRQAWLLGTKTSEIWYLAGSVPFPYQEWPNIFVPYGCAAPYSLIKADVDIFWLASNDQGQAVALKSNGNGVQAISTRALEFEWTTYPKISDVIGGTFQQGGHVFIVFNFPSADKTWAYDLATRQWHRRTWIDKNGTTHRERVAFYASVGPSGGYPKTIIGQDWQTGAIYALDPKFYTDNGTPIVCRRSFPHVMKDMHEITHTSFVADFETGGLVGATDIFPGSDVNDDFNNDFGPSSDPLYNSERPALCMRYSNNGGASFGNYRRKALITSGNYRSMMRYRGLGMARDRVYELMWAINGPSALQGAYIEPIEHGA